VVGLSAALATAGWVISRDLQIGDLDPGAPELRPDSTYNRDAAFLSDRYSSSTDVFVVMVGAAARECNAYTTASTVTRLQWALEEVPEVQGTFSMFNLMGQLYAANYGGDIRWATMDAQPLCRQRCHHQHSAEPLQQRLLDGAGDCLPQRSQGAHAQRPSSARCRPSRRRSPPGTPRS
jgi:predicted RND superfamily exporter protein